MISDFRCTFDNAIGISPEITNDLKLSFPDAYMHADTMAKIAHAMKQKEGAAFCMLPFCHTVEGELRKKNAEAHAYMNFVTEQLIAFGRAQVEAGADVITIADPSGTGEILGPRFFKEFAVRYINQLLDGLADLHVETIVHICGHMKNVYKEVNEVHSNALSFDSAVPMMDARKNLADRVLMGNVSTYTLEFGSEEAVRRLAGNCIKCGSDIVSPACGLGMSSPLRNIQALLSSVEESDG